MVAAFHTSRQTIDRSPPCVTWPQERLVFEQMFKLRLNIKATLLGSGTAQWQSSHLDAGGAGFNSEC